MIAKYQSLVIYVSVMHWYIVLFLDFIDIKIELLSHYQ